MYRLTRLIRKWPILSGFIVIMLVISLLPSGQERKIEEPRENYGVFRGVRQESAKVENADSAFVPNRLAALPPQEYKLYAREFYMALSQGKPDEVRGWQTRSAFGRIEVGEPFMNDAGDICRAFSERYTVAKQTQILSGKACRQKNGAWCKLRSDSVATCRLNEKQGLGTFFEDAKIDMHNLGTDKNRIIYRLRNLF